MLISCIPLLALLADQAASVVAPSNCKAVPGSDGWPSASQWAALNYSLSGHLIKPVPPGALCHPEQPSYNSAACPALQAAWLTTSFHTSNPVSSIENNWNNDTCIPDKKYPCSGKGYPAYVVNATCVGDVKKGVDFARGHNVRLIIKGTGHDYHGRSSGPNSLSIWTHSMKHLSLHQGFKPKGCKKPIDGAAMTALAGNQMGEMYDYAAQNNLVIVGGGSTTVGIGGYLTGGGHSSLSSTFGLAADQVLEMDIVTPGGQILTLNECQNRDLFWAMRGGGASTFGVLTSATIKAYPAFPVASVQLLLATIPENIENYWNVIADILSYYPTLDEQGISGYSYFYPAYNGPLSNFTTVSSYFATLMQPLNSPGRSNTSFAAVFVPLLTKLNTTYPGQFTVIPIFTDYPSWGAWHAQNSDSNVAGSDYLLGSRLLDEKALTADRAALIKGVSGATKAGWSMACLVAGKGVRDATPRGGSNAVNPAWRKSLVHAMNSVGWLPLDAAEKLKQEDLLTNTYVAAYRELAPDTGAYMNEADHNEPNYQHTFWGENYDRLLKIKRAVDPGDVLWCHPCVGNEGWELVGDMLCKV